MLVVDNVDDTIRDECVVNQEGKLNFFRWLGCDNSLNRQLWLCIWLWQEQELKAARSKNYKVAERLTDAVKQIDEVMTGYRQLMQVDTVHKESFLTLLHKKMLCIQLSLLLKSISAL